MVQSESCSKKFLNSLSGNEITGFGEVRLKLDFAVRDSGVGIPFNIQQRLFKPFAQADDSVARRYGGSGLG
ncbi:MAG: ATP-binding protein, partial [Lentisphaeria bacterium]|nr:ATP-binding protein [Lentisphaeria bacterium]